MLFEAHVLVINKHFSSVHTIKIKNQEKIWDLDSPEKLKAWRAERKKNFPRLEVTSKASELREKAHNNMIEKKARKFEEMMVKSAELQIQMLEKEKKRKQDELPEALPPDLSCYADESKNEEGSFETEAKKAKMAENIVDEKVPDVELKEEKLEELIQYQPDRYKNDDYEDMSVLKFF